MQAGAAALVAQSYRSELRQWQSAAAVVGKLRASAKASLGEEEGEVAKWTTPPGLNKRLMAAEGSLCTRLSLFLVNMAQTKYSTCNSKIFRLNINNI